MSYSKLKSILVEKLPRLKELSFGCEIFFHNETETEGEYLKGIYVGKVDDAIKVMRNNNMMYAYHYDIIGHPFTHADILEALGEDWAIGYANGSPYLLKWALLHPRYGGHIPYKDDNGNIVYLPQNLHDLDLPEHKETCERLISLIK